MIQSIIIFSSISILITNIIIIIYNNEVILSKMSDPRFKQEFLDDLKSRNLGYLIDEFKENGQSLQFLEEFEKYVKKQGLLY